MDSFQRSSDSQVVANAQRRSKSKASDEYKVHQDLKRETLLREILRSIAFDVAEGDGIASRSAQRSGTSLMSLSFQSTNWTEEVLENSRRARDGSTRTCT
jgi:hypothetical protein